MGRFTLAAGTDNPEFSRDDHLRGTCWDIPLWCDDVTGQSAASTPEQWQHALELCQSNLDNARSWPKTDKGKEDAIWRMERQIAYITQRLQEFENGTEDREV